MQQSHSTKIVKHLKKVGFRLSESFEIGTGVRQVYLMSLWLFSIYVDGAVRERKARIGREGAKLNPRICT